MVDNILYDAVYKNEKKAGAKVQMQEYDDGDFSYDSEDYEYDENGEPTICDDCQKCVPKSKLEYHKNYVCQMRMGTCPICNEEFVMLGMEEHMEWCVKKDMVACMICNRKMPKADFKDHLIAHNLQ